MKFYVEKAISKKTNKSYYALYARVNDTTNLVLNFDKLTICTLLNLTPIELDRLPIGQYDIEY